MDLEHGSITSKQSDIVFEVNGGSKHLEKPKVLDGRDRDRLSTVLPEATASEGGLLVPSRRLISLSSLSSVESDSSLEDLFQVDTHRISNSAHDISLPRNHDFSSIGPTSTSQASDVTHGSMHGTSPTESPVVQTMDRCDQYDPYRIPSSVFATSKSNKEMEWSVASNESLFSIHLGNNSFSRDRMFFLSDLGKSGELYKSGELFSLSPPPPVPVVETESNRIEEVMESRVEAVAHDSIKDTARIHPVDHIEEKVPPPTASSKSASLSRRSDGSGASTHSFAFPILTDGMKNSVKVAHYIHELEGLESPPAAAAAEAKLSPKRVIKSKPTYWFRCFHWCKWGCSCSHRRSCSCSSCSCC